MADRDVLEPDDGEQESAFVRRCVGDLTHQGVKDSDARIVCAMQWDDYKDDDTEDGFDDATPRTLYVHRDLINVDEFTAWAEAQGFTDVLEDLHVTIIYSKEEVDWIKMGNDMEFSSGADGTLTVAPGGPRVVEPLGVEGAVVLLFSCSRLSWRHEEMVRKGASHDYEEYNPHITITYSGRGVDLSKVEPFRGALEFGPEVFEEIKQPK